MKLTPSQLKSLQWYSVRSNHGQGRICGDSAKLLHEGLLSVLWTGAKTWTLSITVLGARYLRGKVS